MVRMTGLEPAHPAALDPKSSASANSATSAHKIRTKYIKYPFSCQLQRMQKNILDFLCYISPTQQKKINFFFLYCVFMFIAIFLLTNITNLIKI